MAKYFYTFICFFLTLSCVQQTQNHPVHFYIWKSKPELNHKEKEVFEKTKAQKIFLRVFDIDNEHGVPAPKGLIKNFNPKEIDAEYIPTIFITNRSFQNTSEHHIDKMAENIADLVKQIAENHDFNYDEIQIDTDWTSSTKDDFFSFLKQLKHISGKNISSTLRLHQVKYKEQTGVPPVDKVYLMAYATSSPIETEDKNSILDLDLLKDYLQNINDYPLQFDVALPLYSWAIVTNHIGRKKLINGVTEADLDSAYFTKQSKQKFIVDQDVFLKGMYLNKGFTLKIEPVTPELLKDTKHYLNKKVKTPYALVYFHLDRKFTDRFDPKDLL